MENVDSMPRVVSRRDLVSNPWLSLVRKDVAFGDDLQDYYCLRVPDYVAVVALTVDGRIPLVRQYRPAIEEFTLELPAGTVDTGETPAQCCIRELREEVGLEIGSLSAVGSYRPDTGRLQNEQHVFMARDCHLSAQPFVPEPGLEVLYVTPPQLQTLVDDASFPHLLHISALYLAGILPVAS